MNFSTLLRFARRTSFTGLLALMVSGGGIHAANAQQAQPGQFGPRSQSAQAGAPTGQPGAPAAPKADIVATHGDWQIQCGEFANPGSGPTASQEGAPPQGSSGGKSDAANSGATDATKVIRQCGMIQSVRNQERPNVGLTLVLVRQLQGDKMITMMRVLVPIGVFLPTGVALEIDGAAVGRVPFTRCMPQICMAFAEATGDTLAKLKKGTKANFIIYEAPGAGIGMEISLKGFSAALTDLEKQSSS
ncbi:invasion protein IalB [Rhodoligotrophos appendicifer]|uniref:invasion associated locus B family protein n=1 Tax=Rhodoligotrophos appendicifer TaxID=987056 RepID=UPI001186CCCD|nr:invasion associated locus B family protein [Rhodoligotrophos appendicifer]